MNHLSLGLLFTIIGALIIWLANKFRFFRFKELPPESISLRFPLLLLLGYIVMFFVVAPLTMQLMGQTLKHLLHASPPLFMTVLQITSLVLTICYLIVVSILQDRRSYASLWIHEKRRRIPCFFEDFGLGCLTYLVAFPVVVACSQLTVYIVMMITGEPPVDQLAITYLKMARTSPLLLTVALLAILVIAPVIEEFVFRGLLLTYLKQKMGRWGAIIVSAALFALFHYAPQQKASNFSLFFSLFSLAFFLGFLYERQRSLVAPIALHMTFNSISVIRILLFSM